MNIYKNSAKPYYFLVKDTFIVSNNPIRFRLNLLERIKKIMAMMIRLDITNYNTILRKNQQKYWHYHQRKLINMNIYKKKNITF